MTTEYAGITIIIDQGAKRRVINIPRAANVELFTDDTSLLSTMPNVFGGFDAPYWRDPIYRKTVGIKFRPINEYTIREETNPMHIPAPELSEHEQAEVDRFGIHDEDKAVW